MSVYTDTSRFGTDVLNVNPELKVVDSPYDEKVIVMPALTLDAALFHVDRADSRGVCQIKGADHYMDDWFARAAMKAYVSCDELVGADYFTPEQEARFVFGSAHKRRE